MSRRILQVGEPNSSNPNKRITHAWRTVTTCQSFDLWHLSIKSSEGPTIKGDGLAHRMSNTHLTRRVSSAQLDIPTVFKGAVFKLVFFNYLSIKSSGRPTIKLECEIVSARARAPTDWQTTRHGLLRPLTRDARWTLHTCRRSPERGRRYGSHAWVRKCNVLVSKPVSYTHLTLPTKRIV